MVVKTEARKAFSISAFCVSSVNRVPALFSNRVNFLTSFSFIIYVFEKLFLSLASLAGFNSI